MLPFKPLIYAAGATLVIGTLAVGWSGVSSYLRTGASMAGDSIRHMVPKDFEIERISTLVGDLDHTVATQRARLVKQEVDMDYLKRDVGAAKRQVQALEDEVRGAQRLLATEDDHYTINGRTFTRERVVREAQAKAESLVRSRAVHQAKSDTLAALEDALQRADEQIAGAERQRQSYAMRLAELRANADQVAMRQELATTLGDMPGSFDRGAFQRVEENFARIEREIEVQNRLLDRQQKGPRAESITFGQQDDTDIMELLGRALDQPTAPAKHTKTVLVDEFRVAGRQADSDR